MGRRTDLRGEAEAAAARAWGGGCGAGPLRGGGQICGQGIGRRMRLQCGEEDRSAARAWGGGGSYGAGRRTDLLSGRGEADAVPGEVAWEARVASAWGGGRGCCVRGMTGLRRGVYCDGAEKCCDAGVQRLCGESDRQSAGRRTL